jgi:hypothetical protein
MIGFATGYFVDALTGAGLVDQTNNFFGKFLMWTTFAGVAFIRSTSDLEQYKLLLKEARAAYACLRRQGARLVLSRI